MSMNLRYKINIVIFFVLVIFFSIFTCNRLLASNYIIITQSNCTSRDFNFNATIKNNILAQGLLKEAVKILPYDLDDQGKMSLLDFFKQNPLKYVLSYNELEKKNGNENILELKVFIDVDGLKNVLINIGAYFKDNLTCKLIIENFDEQDFIHLSNLLSLSGITKTDYSSRLQLDLKKINNSLYTGTLTFNGQVWAGTSKTLYELWEKLWKNYFNLPEVRNKFFSKIKVFAGPWVTISGFRYFDEILHQKKEILDSVKLIKIEFNKGIYGYWEISSINPSRTTSYLNNYFGKRGMKFRISLSSPGEEKNQNF